jgi:hypothetical protein
MTHVLNLDHTLGILLGQSTMLCRHQAMGPYGLAGSLLTCIFFRKLSSNKSNIDTPIHAETNQEDSNHQPQKQPQLKHNHLALNPDGT